MSSVSGLNYYQKERPTPEQLQDRERDPIAAIMAFAINSGVQQFPDFTPVTSRNNVRTYSRPTGSAEQDHPIADTDLQAAQLASLLDKQFPRQTLDTVHRRFLQKWNIEAPLLACGMRHFVTESTMLVTKALRELCILEYSTADIRELNHIPADYRNIVSHYEHAGRCYHVHQNLVHTPAGTNEPLVQLCSTCWTSIEQKRIPKYSVANGVDFGSASRLSLPPLNLAEEYLVSRSVLFVSLIKLNTSVTGVPQTAKRGHVICFPHRGPSDLADHVSPQLAVVLPNVAAVYSNITVCFVGARQENEALVPDRN